VLIPLEDVLGPFGWRSHFACLPCRPSTIIVQGHCLQARCMYGAVRSSPWLCACLRTQALFFGVFCGVASWSLSLVSVAPQSSVCRTVVPLCEWFLMLRWQSVRSSWSGYGRTTTWYKHLLLTLTHCTLGCSILRPSVHCSQQRMQCAPGGSYTAMCVFRRG
jgi:hypothetical protein